LICDLLYLSFFANAKVISMKPFRYQIIFAFTILFNLNMDARATQMPMAIIPRPVKLETGDGVFTLTSSTVISSAPETSPSARVLADMLDQPTGFNLETTNGAPVRGSCIRLEAAPPDATLGNEGYTLEVTPKDVLIRAKGAAGFFYAFETLRQLLPPQALADQPQEGVAWTMPCVKIEDYPRFAWRGLMLDVARHFESPEFVKDLLDVMAFYKLNVFHWHLTDDQGWRIEIKRYPKLMEIGSRRSQTGNDKTPHSGFYTQAEIRDIVAYAQARNITIVPEIEMPGHSVAALAAYPELSCRGGPFKVAQTWGVMHDVYCAGNETTFIFLENVLTEILDLFPGKYVHIGGDECPKDRWRECAKCQARIKAEGLKDEDELQSYFISRISRFLVSKGRRPVGWDEILEGGLPEGTTVMSWHEDSGAIAAADAGHDAVMAPESQTYFDYYQSRDIAHEPRASDGYLPLQAVYDFEVLPEELKGDEAAHILGGQAQLWGEYMPNAAQVMYMAFPRATALAETLWTPACEKDYADFMARLQMHRAKLDAMKIHYHPFENAAVFGEWKPNEIGERFVRREWDLTPYLTKAGTCEVTFQYSSGAHRLDISKAELLENGSPVSYDRHDGTTGWHDSGNQYRLSLDALHPSSKYSLRATVRTDGGADSTGAVMVKVVPSDAAFAE
jgi:hexosaminidase